MMKPSSPTGVQLTQASCLSGNTEIKRIDYRSYTLEIEIEDETGKAVIVSFNNPIGFRVLDERDLLEFWPTFSTPSGWAFEITANGWHDHERTTRSGSYLVSEMHPNVKEFFFTGCDDCINIISDNYPEFRPKIAEHAPPAGRGEAPRPCGWSLGLKNT